MNEKKIKSVFKGPAYLPNCFAGCDVVVFIIQVAEIMSSGQPLQEFSSLNVHLRQEASSTWTKITKAQRRGLQMPEALASKKHIFSPTKTLNLHLPSLLMPGTMSTNVATPSLWGCGR